ncbi:MAG TPA: hypothetical protein VLS90_19090 [Thermodesulfobacteriota bacterium]|nr:hypothetical protein [Thermodesulfobacteriota bacterium]
MASLLIRNISDETVERLKGIARRNQRSLQQELKVLLDSAVNQPSEDIFLAVGKIRRRLRRRKVRFTDSAAILRKDRSR